ncbi:MAG: hypothetical protein ACI4RA_11195, partial [Kiritimatiellia bacterium]
KSPELVSALSAANISDRLTAALDTAISSGAAAADPDAGARVAEAIQSRQTRELMSARGFTAAQMMAELPISLADGVFATADREKSPEELAKIEAARREREEARVAEEEEAAAEGVTVEELRARRAAEADESTAYREPTAEERAAFDALMDRARFAEEARIAEERRRRSEREKEKAKEGASSEPSASADETGDAAASAALPAETVRRIAPVFDSPELFAQFVVEWTADHVVEKHPEIPNTAEMWRSPVAIRELKQTATHILRQLARDCLGSPALNHARNFADHAINELESDAGTRTYNAIRRRIAKIYDAIHENALRISRRKLVDNLVREIRRATGAKGRFSAVEEDTKRTTDAKTELWARRLIPYLTMSEAKLADEIASLRAITDATPVAQDNQPLPERTPDQVQEAADRLALALKYGGMVRWMPGRIADAADEIMRQVNGARQAFEERREQRSERLKAIRDALVNAMRSGASESFRGRRGVLGRYASSMQGNLTLEMQNLVRYCTDENLRAAALNAIEELQIVISEATGRYRVVLGQAQAELRQGLAAIYGDAEKGIRHLQKEEIPDDVARAVFSQSRDAKPTYGQLLQLYATTIQSDYHDNAQAHGRAAQLPLMKATLTEQDLRFHAWAVEWYRRNRQSLSDAVEAVTGLPVATPDAMYCPARMENEPDGFSVDAVAWSPVPSALNRRVRNKLDFKESANFISLLQEQAEVRAQTIGYAEAGTILRDTLAHRDVQSAARRFVGAADIGAVLDHVRDVLVQNAARKGESDFFAPLNVARAWIAKFYLSGNIPSAVKQLASMPVWANAMIGSREVGFSGVARYLTSVGTDEGRAAIRELMESDGYKARYVMGWSEETQNVLMNPGRNAVAKAIDRIASKGMAVNKFVDAVSCLWMAQGFYREATQTFLDRGLEPAEAKRKAMALTWSVLESGQQSGRVENMNAVQRRGGAAAAAIFQFKTAYLLQNNYLLQALREVRAGTPGANGRLARAAIVNMLYIPAFVGLVNLAWGFLMGEEPPEDLAEAAPQWFQDFTWSAVSGVAAPMFGLEAELHGLWDAINGTPPRGLESYATIPAISGMVRITHDAGRLILYDAVRGVAETMDVFDLEREITAEKLRKDADRLLRDLVAPYRHAAKLYKNRTDR